MGEIYNRLNRKYKKRSVEVQKKAGYLFMVNVIGAGIIFSLLAGLIITNGNAFDIAGDALCLVLVLISTWLLFNGKVYSAGYLSIIGFAGVIFFEYIFQDLMKQHPNPLRIYESLALILIGFALLGLFAIKKTQIILFYILSISLFAFHFGLVIENASNLRDMDLTALFIAIIFLAAGIIISYFTIEKSHHLVKSIEVSRNKAQLKYRLLFNNMHTAYLNIRLIRDREHIITDAIIKETNTSFNDLCKVAAKDLEEKFFSQLPESIKEMVGNLNILMDKFNQDSNIIIKKNLPGTDDIYQMHFYTLKEDSLVLLLFKIS